MGKAKRFNPYDSDVAQRRKVVQSYGEARQKNSVGSSFRAMPQEPPISTTGSGDDGGGGSSTVTYKLPVRIATTANITLSGEQTIDGVLSSADRILVKNQTSGAENGIYVTSSSAWTRASDFVSGLTDVAGSLIPVEEGTANADTVWIVTTDNPTTVNTTALVFAAANQTPWFSNVDGGTFLLNNIADPVSDQDAATKIYVDTKTAGIFRSPVDTTDEDFESVVIAPTMPTTALGEALPTPLIQPSNWDNTVTTSVT